MSRLSRSFALEVLTFMQAREHEGFREVIGWAFNVRCELAVVRCLMKLFPL